MEVDQGRFGSRSGSIWGQSGSMGERFGSICRFIRVDLGGFGIDQSRLWIDLEGDLEGDLDRADSDKRASADKPISQLAEKRTSADKLISP